MKRRLIIALAGLVALAAVAAGGYAWWRASVYVTTDDAYVEGSIAPVSAKVAGHVTELLVRDNQAVKKGDLLFRIDARDWIAKRDQARAAVAVAEATLRAANAELPLARDVTRAQIDEQRAALEQSLVAVRTAESIVEEARARLDARRSAVQAMRSDLAAAEATERKTARELERMRVLTTSGYVSRREHDDALAAHETAAANVQGLQRRGVQTEQEALQMEAELASRRLSIEQARQRVSEARGALARAEGQSHQVTVKTAETARAAARLRETQADLAVAELNVEHTEVRAPIDGVISKRAVEVGQLVQAGQPLLALVPLQDVWVLANFKETQLARIRPGMPAAITIDSYPGKVFHGTVNSIAAGTGARFSLLPPENATGNWVKVVQRVPVKVVLDAHNAGNPQALRAGMSAVVTVRVR